MGKVIVMRGISGSGKSTVARQIAEGEPSVIIVSADHYFEAEDGSYNYDATQIGRAHGRCFRLFIEALQSGVGLVICDNTNVRASDVAPYMMAAEAYGYEASVVEVHCDPKVAVARNTHGTPPEIIERMAARMASSEMPPWWSIVKVNGDA